MNLPNKFQCHYRLTLQWEENGEVFHAVVTDPITIHFNVTKAVLSDVNSAIITIYKTLDTKTNIFNAPVSNNIVEYNLNIQE